MNNQQIHAGQIWQHKRTGRQLRILISEIAAAVVIYLDTHDRTGLSHLVIRESFDLVSEPSNQGGGRALEMVG